MKATPFCQSTTTLFDSQRVNFNLLNAYIKGRNVATVHVRQSLEDSNHLHLLKNIFMMLRPLVLLMLLHLSQVVLHHAESHLHLCVLTLTLYFIVQLLLIKRGLPQK